MTEKLPQEMLITTASGGASKWSADLAARRGLPTPSLPDGSAVDIIQLQTKVNVFLHQLNVVMAETPENVGGFRLSEFEVSAVVVIEGKGEVPLLCSQMLKYGPE